MGYSQDTYQLSEGERWPINLTHTKTFVDDLIKLVSSSSRQEFVQLDKESQVWIGAFRGRSADLSIILVNNIHSHGLSDLLNGKVLRYK